MRRSGFAKRRSVLLVGVSALALLTAALPTASAAAEPLPSIAIVALSDAAPGGDGDGTMVPGEAVSSMLSLGNGGAAATEPGALTAQVLNGPATIVGAPVPVGAIAGGTTVPLAGPTVSLNDDAACDATVAVRFTYTAGALTATVDGTVTVEETLGPWTTSVSADVPRIIPDADTAGITSTLSASGPTSISKVRVTLSATHTYVDDLAFTLASPAGPTVALITHRGGNGENFTGTVLDDDAARPISSITYDEAPFTGSFRPESPLSALRHTSGAGAWTLTVSDNTAGDVGTLTAWRIEAASGQCLAFVPVPAVSAVTPSSGSVSGGTGVTVSGARFHSAATVLFGGAEATVTGRLGRTGIVVTAPSHAPGTVDVTVRNPGERSASLPNAFTFESGPTTGPPPPSAPSVVTSARVQVRGRGHAVVRWSPPAVDGAAVTGYRWRLSRPNKPRSFRAWHTTTATKVVLTKLRPTARYRVQVRALAGTTGGPITTLRFRTGT